MKIMIHCMYGPMKMAELVMPLIFKRDVEWHWLQVYDIYLIDGNLIFY